MAKYIKLMLSSFRIIQSEGFKPFLTYLSSWIKGQRGAYKPGRWPHFPPITYEMYWRKNLLTSKQVTQYKKAILEMAHRPKFAIVTHATESEENFQRLCNSRVTLIANVYPHWMWYILCNNTQKKILSGIALKHIDRIFLISSIEEIELHQKAEMILFLQENDQLSLDALYMLAVEYNRSHPDVIYSDYDYIVPDIEHFAHPVFKPDWSPELMLSFNLLRHLGCYKWELWETYGPDLDNHDFAFKVSQDSTKIVHIPQVLYHRQIENRTADYQVSPTSVANHLGRQGLTDVRAEIDQHGTLKVRWGIPTPSPISIIIPSRDQPKLISRCLSSIFNKTSYPYFEIILVDTGSTISETQEIYDHYGNDPRFKLVNYTQPFNFSGACNFGANHAEGDLLLFLNNDTEILHEDWLHLMSQWFELPDVGIVGSKLLYPDYRLQHIGHIIGLFGLTGHIMQGSPEHIMTIFGSDDWYRNYQAVTGACLMISQAVFEEISRFDEAYQLNYSDVELCLAAYAAGYRIVYTPHVRLIHYESATHKKQVPLTDTQRFHKRLYPINDDPFFNPNLTYQSLIPEIKRHPNDTVTTYYKIRAEMIQETMKTSVSASEPSNRSRNNSP